MIAQFESYLLAGKRYSPHTVKAYMTDLLQFVDFLAYTPFNFKPEDVTSSLVRGWLVELVKSGASPRTVNRKISSITAYFTYLKQHGVLNKLPTAQVIHPRVPRRLPVFVEESVILRNPPNHSDNIVELRNSCVFELLYTTGIRKSELLCLKHSDVDLVACTVRVFGKGGKERIIPLLPSTFSLLKYYIAKKELEDLESGQAYLFLTARGKQMYGKLVENIVKETLKNAGVNGKKSPHVLRHTFATHLLNHGADLLSIKELLGHESIGTTQVYTHNTLEKIRESYIKAHPRADSK